MLTIILSVFNVCQPQNVNIIMEVEKLNDTPPERYNQIIVLDEELFSTWLVYNDYDRIKELAIISGEPHKWEQLGIPVRQYEDARAIPIHPHWRYLVIGSSMWSPELENITVMDRLYD